MANGKQQFGGVIVDSDGEVYPVPSGLDNQHTLFTSVRKQWEDGCITGKEYHTYVIANLDRISHMELQTFVIDCYSF